MATTTKEEQVAIYMRALDMLDCLAELVDNKHDTPIGVRLSEEGARGFSYLLKVIHGDLCRVDVEASRTK